MLSAPEWIRAPAIAVTATGYLSLWVVQFWTRLWGMNAQLNSGTFTFSGLYLFDERGVVDKYGIPLKGLATTANILYLTPADLPAGKLLMPGWRIATYVDAKTINGDIVVTLLLQRLSASVSSTGQTGDRLSEMNPAMVHTSHGDIRI